MNIPVTGEPEPTIQWDFEGRPIESDDRLKVSPGLPGLIRVQITNEDGKTKFVVKRAQRDDTGTFHIVATNEHGTDRADVIVTVLDRPSPPQGPLNIDNIHKNGWFRYN